MAKVFGALPSFVEVEDSFFLGLSYNEDVRGLWCYQRKLIIGFWDKTKISVRSDGEGTQVWRIDVLERGHAFAKLTRSVKISDTCTSDVFEINSEIQYVSLHK